MPLPENLAQQLAFVLETDKLKGVLRKTSPIGLPRKENSAEHSWQAALCAVLFAEYAAKPVDIGRVVKMLLIHDAVEVDAGDTFHYAKEADPGLHDREERAAQRLFGLLPQGQSQELLDLWREFEARQTLDAQYAASIDRLMAFLMNHGNGGGTWAEFSVPPETVLAKNASIEEGSNVLWLLAQHVLAETISKEWDSSQHNVPDAV